MNDPAHDGRSLPPPAVPSAVYDGDYYSHWCAGYEQWMASGGAQPDSLYEGSLALARLSPGDVVVDIGAGRGEFLAVAVAQGASRAIGIEYSASALDFARTTMEVAGVEGKAAVIAADSRQIPLPDGIADLVTMLDVVEHLSPAELHQTLVEARRVLRPGGRVFAHTLPTRTIYNVTYRVQRLLVPGRRARWPADPRVDLERIMHVNEQTRSSLLRALRGAGFTSPSVQRGKWVHDSFVPDPRARRVYHRLAAHRLTAGLGIADLWAEAIRPMT
ncbi:MAG: SAM-dependent methyltransferase [Acidimicrobiales bacterium]